MVPSFLGMLIVLRLYCMFIPLYCMQCLASVCSCKKDLCIVWVYCKVFHRRHDTSLPDIAKIAWQKKQLTSFMSPDIMATILLCYKYLFLHFLPKIFEQLYPRSYQGYGSWESFYWVLRRVKSRKLPLWIWFQPCLGDSTRTMSTGKSVLGNVPWLSSPMQLYLNQGCGYFFANSFLCLHILVRHQ